MRVVFDENMPVLVARAVRILTEPEPIEVVHARDFVSQHTPDVALIQAITEGHSGKTALITTDKSMHTRDHERAAYTETGCIGIVLVGRWNHASMWERAQQTLLWWPMWITQIEAADRGTLWQCPWGKPKRMNPLQRRRRRPSRGAQ